MNIVIMGNGFDLAHDLKSSYKNFIDSDFIKKHMEDIKNFNYWYEYFKRKNNDIPWIDVETEIYEEIKRIDEKLKRININEYTKFILIKKDYTKNNFNISNIDALDIIYKLIDYLKNITNTDDLYKKLEKVYNECFNFNIFFNNNYNNNSGKELELKIAISNNIDRIRNIIQNYMDHDKKTQCLGLLSLIRNEFLMIMNEVLFYKDSRNKKGLDRCFYYYEGRQGLIYFLYEELKDFTTLFKKYLKDYVIKKIDNQKDKYYLNLENFSKNNSSSSKEIYLLNFNYTDAFMKLYKNDLKLKDFDIKDEIYIHGSIEDDNMILGTDTFNKDDKIDPSFNIFTKYNMRHKENTIEKYQNLLKTIKKKDDKEPINFFILGHSLSKTDHKILRHLLNASKNIDVFVYYHDEETLDKLQFNMNEMMGEDFCNTYVKYRDQHDEKHGFLIKR